MINYVVTSSANASEISEGIKNFRYVGIFVGVLVCIVGTLGNLLTIVAYLTNKKLQTKFNIFIFNLSIVDFVTSLFMIPFHVISYINMSWPFEDYPWTERFQAFFYFSCGYISVDFLVVITINRLLGVLFPSHYNTIFAEKNLKAIIFGCYVFAPAFLSVFLFLEAEGCPGNHTTGFNKQQLLCTFICLQGTFWTKYMKFTRVLFQLSPFPLMIFVYSIIFWKKASLFSKFRKIMIRRPNINLRSKETSFCVTAKKQVDDSRKKFLRSNKKLLKISTTICAAFAIVFIPSVILNLLDNSNTMDPRIHMACSNLSWFNSLINPIVYAVLNSKFRIEYRKIIRNLINKLKLPTKVSKKVVVTTKIVHCNVQGFAV